MNLRAINGRAGALVAILLFVIAKIPHLFYAFFWDESWVYAPAIKLMYAHGPSIFPGAIPVEYSRGHPLLYHAACAAWMRVFGDSNLVMHCFALFISIGLATGVYECIRRLFGSRCAFVCLILLLLNLSFFGSSTFVLTDIPLALFAFLGLYAYCGERYVLAAVLMSLLFLMKESGVVMAVIVSADIVVDIFSSERSLKPIIGKSCALVCSILPLVALFVAQKKLFGWYLYPGHTSIIHLGVADTLAYLRRSLRFLFYTNKAFLPLVPLMALLGWYAVSQRKIRYLAAVITAIVVYLLIDVFSSKDAVFYVFAALIPIVLVVFLRKPLISFTMEQQRFIKLSVSFTVVFIYFCCINFFEDRYLFPALIFTIILLGIAYNYILDRSAGQLGLGLVLLFLATTGIINLALAKDDLDVYDRIRVQQHLVDYLEQHRAYNRNIYTRSFLAQVHLEDPNTGFRHTSKAFAHVSDTIDSKTELAAFDNVEFDSQYEVTRHDTNFILLDHYQVNEIWVDIFTRKPTALANTNSPLSSSQP